MRRIEFSDIVRRSRLVAAPRWVGVAVVVAGLASVHQASTAPLDATFGPQRIIQKTDTLGARVVLAADLDGDGDQDIVSASFHDSKIAWYENDGAARFGPQRVIATSAIGPTSLFAADLDGDGDIDLLSASKGDDRIAWYENVDGRGKFGPATTISNSADDAKSVFAADLDGDGDQDVLSASTLDDKISWYENTDGNGTFGPERAISVPDPDGIAENGNEGDADGARAVFAADIDGDGDIDVLSASNFDDKIAWYENTDGLATFGPQQVISTSNQDPYALFAEDLDGDGDIDVVSASRRANTIAWHENLGAGTFAPMQTITTSAHQANSVFVADLDGDGDRDVLSASLSDYTIAWYENVDGAGAFGGQRIISGGAAAALSVFAADMDGDGDLDVLSASAMDNKIAWYENRDGKGGFAAETLVTSSADGPVVVFGVDLDADGDQDVLVGSIADDRIAWYENLDGRGKFASRKTITNSANGLIGMYPGDIDGDGDYDVISASAFDDKIAWYENLDGRGSFGRQRVITTEALSAYSIFAADLDGDGDLDVISGSRDDRKVAWYENTDGKGSFGPPRIVATLDSGNIWVHAADLDGDGDFDIVAGWRPIKGMGWFENLDGRGTFGPLQIVTTSVDALKKVISADLDGDGDLDLLSTSWHDDKVAWYENLDGRGNFGPQRVITHTADGASGLIAVDVDGDGDLDVVAGWAASSGISIAWYENRDGLGDFGPERIVTFLARRPESIFAADIDGDGDPDLLSASLNDDKIAWYENLTPLPNAVAGWEIYQ